MKELDLANLDEPLNSGEVRELDLTTLGETLSQGEMRTLSRDLGWTFKIEER